MSHKDTPPAPARLHVIMASDAPYALILRRGPSDWYHLILWDTLQDSFERGAWIKGRIYEHHCDLSPDGKLLLYLVTKYKHADRHPSYGDTWAAVSRPPWLYALTLWSHRDPYDPPGYFADNRTVVLHGKPIAHPGQPVRGFEVLSGSRNCVPAKRPVPEGCWSGFDHDGHPIYTQDGRLYRRLPRGDIELADFNDPEPNPQPAPAWAREPLPALKPTPKTKPKPGPHRRKERRAEPIRRRR